MERIENNFDFFIQSRKALYDAHLQLINSRGTAQDRRLFDEKVRGIDVELVIAMERWQKDMTALSAASPDVAGRYRWPPSLPAVPASKDLF